MKYYHFYTTEKLRLNHAVIIFELQLFLLKNYVKIKLKFLKMDAHFVLIKNRCY